MHIRKLIVNTPTLSICPDWGNRSKEKREGMAASLKTHKNLCEAKLRERVLHIQD